MTDFGKHIKKLRQKRRFTQESFAEESDMARVTFSQIETGAYTPNHYPL